MSRIVTSPVISRECLLASRREPTTCYRCHWATTFNKKRNFISVTCSVNWQLHFLLNSSSQWGRPLTLSLQAYLYMHVSMVASWFTEYINTPAFMHVISSLTSAADTVSLPQYVHKTARFKYKRYVAFTGLPSFLHFLVHVTKSNTKSENQSTCRSSNYVDSHTHTHTRN